MVEKFLYVLFVPIGPKYGGARKGTDVGFLKLFRIRLYQYEFNKGSGGGNEWYTGSNDRIGFTWFLGS